MISLLVLLVWLVGTGHAATCSEKAGTETTKTTCISTLAGRYVWYNDADGDDYNDATVCCCPLTSACSGTSAAAQPDGYAESVSRTKVDTLQWDDCQDADASVNPGVTETWYDGLDENCAGDSDFDQDGDGYYSDAYTDYTTVTPGTATVVSDGSASLGADCDDTDPDIHPGATEIPNGKDDDCDGLADEGTTAYDDDGDCACEGAICIDTIATDCVALVGGDCDDTDPDVGPDATEIWYDGVDQNCDGLSDYDQDGDGSVPDAYVGLPTIIGSTGAVVEAGLLPGGDCDDTSAEFGSSVTDIPYDGFDSDCGGNDDYDGDGDGYVPTADVGLTTIEYDGTTLAGSGTLPGGDCADSDAAASPGVAETWYDGIDEDCDGACDFDADGDGYNIDVALIGVASISDTIDPGTGSVVCAADMLPGSDCADGDPAANPGATEIWYDGDDQNCDGASDYDQDGDGFVPDAYVGSKTTVSSTGEVVDSGTLPGGDCDDTSSSIGPGTPDTWYDGLDADCGGNDDYDQDGDGYVPTIYVGLPTYGSDGTAISGTGSLPDDDCDDTDSAVNPGVAETWYDAIDENCNGDCDFDQDADGYTVDPALLDLDSIPDTVEPGTGEVVCAGDSLPTDDCVDDEATLLALDPTSTKDPANIHPNADETCEARDGVQIDDDCNGSINTQGTGDDESYITSDWGTPYYRDADGDGAGDPSTEYYLCEEVDGFTTSFGDCDDTNADVNPDASEICNNADDNCDGQIDEASNLGTDSGCINLYPDRDLDGYGDTSSPTCMCYDGQSDECGDGYEYNDEDSTCYTKTNGDCYDYDSSIHPRADGEPLIEYMDGNDNDCNGEVPLVELDCDDDGSLPLLPVQVDPTTPISSAADLGLADCRGPSNEADPDCCARGDCADGETCDDLQLAEFVTCWDDFRLRLKCDPDTGLIVVSQAADGVADRFDGGRRLYPKGQTCTSPGDCDDTCAARCPDLPEVCDGVDNDCDNATTLLNTPDTDGIPDALDETEIVPGYVNISELDQDGDGYLGCKADDLVDRAQDVLSTAACATSSALGDCNDTCSLSSPVIKEERCDGFLNICDSDPEGTDGDQDDYLTCGAWGPADGKLAEDIYTLVYVPEADETGDTADTSDTASAAPSEVVPLLLPRPEAPECDAELEGALADLVGDDTLTKAEETGDPEPLLALCAAAESCRQIREGASLSWPASCQGITGACTVARMTLSPSADDADYDDDVVAGLDAVADCSSHPEQVITRTVWSQERILAARSLVVQWDCFRMNGTFGCGDLSAPDGWVTPFPDGLAEGGNVGNADPGDALSTDARWWKEMGRYSPEPMLDAVMEGCWGDPTPGASTVTATISRQTGGDCADSASGANRGTPEGPDDLLGIYDGQPADCSTCTDGLDNNCNGLMDCAEPACARCFVSQGSGCGGGTQSPCAESGCASAPTDEVREPGALALIGILLAATGQLLRRER